MIEVNSPKVDSEQLLARVREVVAQRRQAVAPGEGVATGAASPSRIPAMLAEVDRLLRRAAEHWAVGMALPPMGRRTGLVRRVTTPVAQAVLRIAQLVTRDQRAFNQATLEALERTRDALAELSREQRRFAKEEVRAPVTETAEEAANKAWQALHQEIERAVAVATQTLQQQLSALIAERERERTKSG